MFDDEIAKRNKEVSQVMYLLPLKGNELKFRIADQLCTYHALGHFSVHNLFYNELRYTSYRR